MLTTEFHSLAVNLVNCIDAVELSGDHTILTEGFRLPSTTTPGYYPHLILVEKWAMRERKTATDLQRRFFRLAVPDFFVIPTQLGMTRCGGGKL